ncbi:thioesterase family protein [Ilumatobacter sp.]|uniref:thioesterase family protein n=1 Tax=Ilumatobacter sp. TaxID=1967498 RepID=UPI003B520B24
MASAHDLTVTHTSTVTEDQIDHLGHMNVRHYASNAHAATLSVLERLGRVAVDEGDLFDMYTRHHREQLLGAELEVRSGVLGVDQTSIRLYHELVASSTGELAATFVHRVRSSTPFDVGDTVAIPEHGAPRSIDLEAQVTAPPLDTVRELGLEQRGARVVDRDDTGGGETVRAHLVPNLIWGGTPPDGSEQQLVHLGADGRNVGYATMETRVGVVRLPPLGTPIQSFGATTAMADKTTQMSMWVYDLDRADLLASFEVVNVLFDIDARRASSIPDDMRAEHRARMHPELAPRRS